MQVRENFDIREFVPPYLWELHEDGVLDARWYVQPTVLDIAQAVRDRYAAPVEVNTWLWGGDLLERGYRFPGSDTGATYSQHKLGNAVDFEVDGMSPQEVRADIKQNEQRFLRMGLTTIESGEYATGWVHVDCRPTEQDGILIVTP